CVPQPGIGLLAAAAVGATALAVWPPWPHPFSWPKLGALAIAAVAVSVWPRGGTRSGGRLAAALAWVWVVALGLSGFLGSGTDLVALGAESAAGLWLLGLVSRSFDARPVEKVLGACGAI